MMLLEGLIQDAISTLHHDTTNGSDVDKYERECLRKKFSARLAAKPAADDVREATIEECAKVAENHRDSLYIVRANIARDIRALSTKAKP